MLQFMKQYLLVLDCLPRFRHVFGNAADTLYPALCIEEREIGISDPSEAAICPSDAKFVHSRRPCLSLLDVAYGNVAVFGHDHCGPAPSVSQNFVLRDPGDQADGWA